MVMVMVSIMIMVVVLTIITIPVALGVPLMVANTPPCMMQLPAALALGVQIASAVIRLGAECAMPVDSVVESALRPFNPLRHFALSSACARGVVTNNARTLSVAATTRTSLIYASAAA